MVAQDVKTLEKGDDESEDEETMTKQGDATLLKMDRRRSSANAEAIEMMRRKGSIANSVDKEQAALQAARQAREEKILKRPVPWLRLIKLSAPEYKFFMVSLVCSMGNG